MGRQSLNSEFYSAKGILLRAIKDLFLFDLLKISKPKAAIKLLFLLNHAFSLNTRFYSNQIK